MPERKPAAFRIYVLLVCTAWFAVPIAALWGLDWRWIPTAFVAAVVALIVGGLVENQLHERAADREAHRAAIAAEEEAWLGGTDQPR
jgi:hypothetical protein